MKTNRILLYCSVLFLLLSMEPLHAQNGTQALDKVVGKFQQSNGISATFTLSVFNALNEPVEKQNGTIKLSGNKFYWNTTVSEFLYEKKLTGAKLHNVKTGEDTEISVDGAFISIGRKPASELFEGILDMDEAGYIVADESTRTNIPGVFAIGDVRTKALRQVVTAVADGATASHYIEEYLAHQI